MEEMNSFSKADQREMWKLLKSYGGYTGNETVLKFIQNFMNHAVSTTEQFEAVWNLFMAGYCYYFASILQKAFNRGTVCWCAPYGHFVWCDVDGTPYDCGGVYNGEADYFIPEEFMGGAIYSFKHIPGVGVDVGERQINDIIIYYENVNNLV